MKGRPRSAACEGRAVVGWPGALPQTPGFSEHSYGVRWVQRNGLGQRVCWDLIHHRRNLKRGKNRQWSDRALVESSCPGAAQTKVFQRRAMKIAKLPSG